MFPYPPIPQLVAAMRAGELSPVSLLDSCLEQIDRHEPSVRAWVSVDRPGARAAAEQIAARLATGDRVGSLCGIPVGIKDIIDVAGSATKAGSPLREDHLAPADAELVRRLRAAGAIILGKTVTTQYASFDPPKTRNPWNLNHTPGGSSSGSAAAVATGMCVASVGTQTGGSITRPASYCGVAGAKPNIGRVSTDGVVPLSFTLDHPGPMARCVTDLTVMLHVMSGPELGESLLKYEPADGYAAAAEHTEISPRLGRLSPYFWEFAEPETLALLDGVLDQLAAAGARLDEAPLPRSFDQVHEHHLCVMAVEAAAYHQRDYQASPDEYGPAIGKLLNQGLETRAIEYAGALAHRREFRHQILHSFEGCDVLVVPAAPGPAPGPETTGDPRFNSPWSYCGLPTVSIPIGLSSAGLPVAMQLVGRPWSEVALLATALWCERQLALELVPAL